MLEVQPGNNMEKTGTGKRFYEAFREGYPGCAIADVDDKMDVMIFTFLSNTFWQ